MRHQAQSAAQTAWARELIADARFASAPVATGHTGEFFDRLFHVVPRRALAAALTLVTQAPELHLRAAFERTGLERERRNSVNDEGLPSAVCPRPTQNRTGCRRFDLRLGR